MTVLGTLSTVGNPYTYTGQRFDPETGLLYYKNRYYSPQLGRFLSRDPLGYSGDFDLFEYVKDNPVNLVDPTGLRGRRCQQGCCYPWYPGGCNWYPVNPE